MNFADLLDFDVVIYWMHSAKIDPGLWIELIVWAAEYDTKRIFQHLLFPRHFFRRIISTVDYGMDSLVHAWLSCCTASMCGDGTEKCQIWVLNEMAFYIPAVAEELGRHFFHDYKASELVMGYFAVRNTD